MKKLSLRTILEDINIQDFVNRWGEATEGAVGYYAFCQAYNRLIYDGVINSPPLNIEASKSRDKQFSFSKSSFKTSPDPQGPAEGMNLHDTMHLVTVNLAKHFARLRAPVGAETEPTSKANRQDQKYFKGKPGTPAQYAKDVGQGYPTQLTQHFWEEEVGNLFADKMEEFIQKDKPVNPANFHANLMKRLLRGASVSLRMREGMPPELLQKYTRLFNSVIIPLLTNYNTFLNRYKMAIEKYKTPKPMPDDYDMEDAFKRLDAK